MKSPGIIYRKYRQLKRFFILQEYQNALKKDYNNCSFCKILQYKDKYKIERNVFICTHQENNNKTIELKCCDDPKKCTFFLYKETKETIKNKIESNFNNQDYVKRNYPELYLLQWVLDYDTEKYKKKNSFLSFLIFKIIDFLNYLAKFL